MPAERTPRVRLVAVPDHLRLVVRGESDADRTDAARFRRRFDDWGRFGVSGFLAKDVDEVAVIGETRLERFPQLRVYERRALIAIGLEVAPTFRRPHVTIAHVDLDALVAGLAACDHVVVTNIPKDERST